MMHDTMDYIDNFTNLYENFASTCGTLTDTVYRYANPIPEAENAFGYGPCVDYTGYLNLFCERAQVWINNILIWEYGGGFNGDPDVITFNIEYNIRHETGHNMGFGHPYSSTVVQAMQRGFQDPPNLFYLAYITHDRDHLNAFYP